MARVKGCAERHSLFSLPGISQKVLRPGIGKVNTKSNFYGILNTLMKKFGGVS
jgi:hypothetical protein